MGSAYKYSNKITDMLVFIKNIYTVFILSCGGWIVNEGAGRFVVCGLLLVVVQ